MTVIHDLRPITPRSNGTRLESAIKHIARHHSATTTGDWYTFWPYWNKVKGWGTGGYHELILRDGSVQLCYDPNEITNGVGGHNSTTYNICVVGNGSFTDVQERTWEERCLINIKRFGLSPDDVKGHREFIGTNTACPGIDMGMVRNRLKYLQGNMAQTVKDYLQNGDTGAAVKKLQENLKKIGLDLSVDGSFGPGTEKALKAFQSANGLNADGYYGPATKSKLESVLNEKDVTPVAKPIDKPKEEENKLIDTAIVVNSFNDIPAVEKLSIRLGCPFYFRSAVKSKQAKHLIIAGGGVQNLAKFTDKVTDLSGKNRETTANNVTAYMNK